MKTKFLTAVLIVSGLLGMASETYAWNKAPEAVLVPVRQYVIVGGRAILDGNDPITPSYDVDEDGYIITKYEWDFTYNGASFICDYWETSSSYPDGAFDGRTMTSPYTSTGTYTAALRVTDDESTVSQEDTCQVYVCSDSDGDSLPDDWEDLYSELSDSNSADADEDSDGDGYNNLCEYLHGSEPDDISNVPNANFPIKIYVPSDVNSIQRAINASIDGDTIIVSQGRYYEVIDFDGASCTVTSTDPNDWDVVANTIIDANDTDANVVTFDDSEGGDSVIKGFTITGGGRGMYCEDASPTIINCVIIDNGPATYGGGVYCYDGSSPTINNCVFSGNTATLLGGGMYNFFGSYPILTNCVFSGNKAVGDADANGCGGGIANYYSSSPTLYNCTFIGNSAEHSYGSCGFGGGIYNSGYYDPYYGHLYGSSPELINCIFWGNHADGSNTGDEIYNNDDISDPSFRYCDIKGCMPGGVWDPNFGSNEGGNIDSDPGFIDSDDPIGLDGVFGTYDDGLRMHADSPCIEAGDPNTDPNDVGTADLSGNDRIVDADHDDVAVIDMGAYELPRIWYVDIDANTGNDDGNSWPSAFIDLQDALAAASDGDEIWVAEGTYEPNDGNDRSVSFQLVTGVGLYGGFTGTETGYLQRNRILHETILSGDIGTPVDQNDNSYHVVKGTNKAVLDGFTITGGMADGSGSDAYGAGISCSSTSPIISNCTITANKASQCGGGIYTYYSSPALINCTVADNTANTYGGGLYEDHSSTQLTNCVLAENEAGWGGGMYNSYSSSTLTSSTFSGNEATNLGGGMVNVNSSPTVTNCIFWADSADSYPEIINSTSNPIFSYCDIEGCGGSSGWNSSFGTDGGGNIDCDPCFVDINNPAGADGIFFTWDDGLRLDANSLCIDAADGNSALLQDMMGLERIDISGVDNNGVGEPNYVDIGAYESYDKVDSDSDGMPDDYEILHGLDPSKNDANDDLDGDGLSNLLEYQIGTWASSVDTDGDGMDDGWEYKYGLDPLDKSDASGDADGDGKNNLDEYNDDGNPVVYNTVSVIVYEYDNAGQVTKETTQDGDGNDVAVAEYKYDELGRRWQQRRWANVSGSSNANDIITLYSYDTRSNTKKTVRKGVGGTDPNSIQTGYDLVTESFYSSLGGLTDVNDPNGGNTHYTYDQGGAVYQVTDPNGNTTTSYYDGAGRLEKVTDAEGHYRLSYYNSLGQTIKQIACDSGSNALMQTRSEYNGLGRVIRRAVMADADSEDPISTTVDMVVDYNYADSNGLLIYARKYYNSGTAATTLYGYDGLGRRTDISDPGGNLTKIFYNEGGQVTRRQQIEKDPIGSNDLTITTDFYYDSLGRLLQQVAKPENPDEEDDDSWQMTTYYYNALGNRTQEIRQNSVVTTYKYTALGRLTEKIADAIGAGNINQKTEYGYDRLGRQTSITGYVDEGSSEQTTSYTYDALNRIIEVNYPDDNYIAFEYNPAGKVVKRTDQRGIVTEYSYNGIYNMLAKYVDGNGETDDANEVFTYDGLGRMLTATKEVDSNTIETEFAYNDIGKITDTNDKIFGGTERETRYTYDQAGFPIQIFYPGGPSWFWITSDWQGRIDTLRIGITPIAKYKYIGSRVAQRNYRDLIYYEPTYDNLGRITSADSDTGYAKFDYEYDPNTNNLSRQIYDHRTNPVDDPCTDFSYDNLDRLTAAEYSIDDTNEAFTIDDLGNRKNVNVRNGFDVTYSVDANTNRYGVINVLDDAVAYWKMDDNAANTTVVDSSGNGHNGTFNDATGNPNTDAHDTTGKINGALTFDGTDDYITFPDDPDYESDTEGAIVAWIKIDSTGSYQTIYGYGDSAGTNDFLAFQTTTTEQLTINIRIGGTNNRIDSVQTFNTDTWYHVAVVSDGSTNTDLYIDGQNVSTTIFGGSEGKWFDDVASVVELATIGALRRSSIASYFDGSIDNVMIFDEALSEDEIQTLYNCGNLSYDAAGSLTTDQRGYEYEYDYENRIVKIIKGMQTIAEFAYDALGRRVEKKDLIDPNNTRRYYHNYNWQVLAEYNGSGVFQQWFAYGNYIDEVLMMGTTGSPTSARFYIHDHLYSPAALTNFWGTVLERYEYDAYGNPTIWNGDFTIEKDAPSWNPYLFTGRRVDILDSGSLKIQYNRNRYYDYYTGRWLTHDPLGITPNPQRQSRFEPLEQFSDGLCLYTYVSDRPVIGSDPDGKSWDCVPILRTIICDYRLEHRSFPGMRLGDYAHCMPSTPPSMRTENEIKDCKTCVQLYYLKRSDVLWTPVGQTGLAEGVATLCLIFGGAPGAGIPIVAEGVINLGCTFDIWVIMQKTAKTAKSACEGDFEKVRDDLDKIQFDKRQGDS